MTIEAQMLRYDDAVKELMDVLIALIGEEHWFTKFFKRRLNYFRDQLRVILVEEDL
jgi:hypothetical protein